ncbi:endo-1,3-alpha-glucanase family glycosylhydrolase [Bradyrhizobium vignae]|uniref:endo-1,3-alpha-glucanase family glycosylhydrolase n=1 Tax=Bradyrhizobium vignae TaxID=1549949 RepID=UPI00100BDD48|nr:endo-1,3-alpha-glucanase family glycosylhydrolase [Bradyrhizobium vignae]RXG85987.1 hypothetical protein EAV90_34420 [Bradyrhizobium vignae]
MKSLLIAALLCLWADTTALQAGEHSHSALGRKVFAHYMACCPRFGHSSTVEQYQIEILAAQSRGIDGFSVILGAWTSEPFYIDVVTRLFEAARRLNTSFKLMLSPGASLKVEEVAEIVSRFANEPALLKLSESIVLSTYGGDTDWLEQLRQKLQDLQIRYVNVAFLDYPVKGVSRAFFGVRGFTKNYNVFEQVLAENPTLDGYFYFSAGEPPDTLARSIMQISRNLRARGKISMMGVSPYYRGLEPNNSRVFESEGFSGMARQWRAIIDSEADWAEVVTWNDWGEATYVAPFGGPMDQALWEGHWGPLLAHEKFLDASRYYIEWFKKGRAPKIRCDKLYYFYRPHLKDAIGLVYPDEGKLGRPRGWQRLRDAIYFAAFFTRPITVSIKNGSNSSIQHVDAGVSTFEIPIHLGEISIEIQDQQGILASKRLEFAVLTDGSVGNFNYFAGEMPIPKGSVTTCW